MLKRLRLAWLLKVWPWQVFLDGRTYRYVKTGAKAYGWKRV